MLEIKNISARLGNFALKNISLSIETGDYLTVLGLSGAGKTVLLEIIAGLVKPSEGDIWVDGMSITHQSIQKRPVGLVYQDMALFPHISVGRNIAYPLRGRGLTKNAIHERVKELAHLTHVSHLLDRQPGTLSGGEAQRVALARVLASDPKILLLDEPLASLDVKLRQELRLLLRDINQSGKTIIHVTHDHMEAATLSKKIAIIENGELLQWGKPDDVFRNPVSEFVARFSGIKNIFLCLFKTDNSNENGNFEGLSSKGEIITLLTPPPRPETYLMIPGEDIIVSESRLQTSAINQYEVSIVDIFTLHHGIELIVRSREDFSVIITQRSAESLNLTRGRKVWISFKASAVKYL
jgi:molybdate/tungstate transport system ATP-binding protein